ncbi:MAG: TetR/AcrR family transcriptional regulator [Oxalobacteraceae bacterium]|nr:TetR/AcrR family transcriptional regulator [Oxalobacteraceae bacterium]
MPTLVESRSRPRWERRKDARPQELLAAALDLFVERGYAATRLDEVAARAGVSKGTLYLYFENKEELFKAVVRENMVPPLADAEELINNFEGHSSHLLRLCIDGWWQRIGATKLSGISKLMMAESVVSRGGALLARIIERGVALDEFRPVDTTMATRVIIAPMLMLTMWRHSLNACHLDPIDPDAFLDCLVDLLTRGFETPNSRFSQER